MTVREITSPELTKLRGNNQYAEVFVIPRIPNVIYSAQLGVVPSTTDMVAEIQIVSGSGDETEIREDMKVLVGTSEGGDDLGFCRVRKVPTISLGSGDLEIGELSHINWQADCYITIVDDYDIFPRHLKIVSGVPYIDYGIEYSSQHEEFAPVVNMGGHRVIVLSDGEVSHSRSASQSFVFDGTISSYLWEAPNADSIDNHTTSDAVFNYTEAGHFCEYLTITTDDGKSWTGVRYVFVLSESPTDSDVISLKVEEDAVSGVSFEFDMPNNSSISDFKHRAFVIAFFRTYYQISQSYISYKDEEENILACGRISSERVVFNDEIGNVSFSVSNSKYWLEKISSFPIGFERPLSTPSAWTEINGLNVDRAVWALLHEYSTATRICDFNPSGDTRYAEELSSAGNNLSSQIDEIALTSIFADLVFDRYESAWLRVEPQLVPSSSRSGWVVVQELTSNDYEDGISFELNTYDEVSQMNLSGVSVSQYGVGSPHFSLSYGRVFSVYGSPSQESNLLLESQSQSNSLSGLFMGWSNRKFDSIVIKFVGINTMFSIAEYCRASINITSSSNPRGISYNGYLCPRSISYEWEENTGLFLSSVEFQDESIEQISVTGDFPSETDIDVDFSIDPPAMPVFPPIAMIPIPAGVTNTNQPKKVAICTNQGIFYTEDFDASTPTWIAMNDGLSSLQKTGAERMVHTSNGRLYILTDWDASRGYLYCMGVGGLGGSWFEVVSADEYPVDPTMSGLYGIAADTDSTDRICVHAARKWNYPYDLNIGEQRVGFGSGSSFAWSPTFSSYPRLRQSGVGKAGNKWYLFLSGGEGIVGSIETPQLFILSNTGAFDSFFHGLSYVGQAERGLVTMGYQNKVMFWDKSTATGHNMSTGLTLTGASSPDPKFPYAMAWSTDGLIALGSSGLLKTPYKTTDGGTSWSSLGGVLAVGFDVWENCKDNNRWILAGGTEIRLTMDAGASFLNKAGNLSMVAPLTSIKAVRFIE